LIEQRIEDNHRQNYIMNKIKDNDSRISEMNFLKARKQVEIANIQAELRQQEKVLDELIARARLQTGYDVPSSFLLKVPT